jgi:hypothetical protein
MYGIALTATSLSSGPLVTPSQDDWDRNFIDSGPTADASAVRVELTYLCSRQGHLIAEFHVGNLSKATVRLAGTESSDGRFWPDVVSEVTNGSDPAEWKWQNIGRSYQTGKPFTLAVAAQSFSVPLCVNMDVFKPQIGKASYGRVVFTNGNWSMFELSDLLPTKSNK